MDLENIYFMCIDAKDMAEIFAPGEVDRIYLNFSDPWPKDRHAKRRLTSPVFMSVYDKILAPRGVVEFKTDNRGLFEYSWNPFQMPAGEITEYTFDLHNSPMAEGNVMTEYEMKFASEGKPICKLIARRTGTSARVLHKIQVKGYHQEADNMALPPGITKKLLQATSDKTDLNKQALRFNRSFKEVGKLLGSGSAKAKKDKDKNNLPNEDTSAPSRLFLTGTGSRGRRNSEKSPSKNHESPGKKIFQRFFLESVDILLFRRYNGERAVETAAQQNEKKCAFSSVGRAVDS